MLKWIVTGELVLMLVAFVWAAWAYHVGQSQDEKLGAAGPALFGMVMTAAFVVTVVGTYVVTMWQATFHP